MIRIRKAESKEMKDIVRVANAAFAPEREEGFDFRNIQPKAYKDGKDSASSHFLVLHEKEIVALAGNLHAEMAAGEKTYPYAFVGTVSTLPAHRNQGYMKALMAAIDEEDRRLGVVFSALTGLRKRYNRFGYEKCSTTYRFSVGEYCLRDYPSPDDLVVQPYAECDFSALFDLYRKTQPSPTRAAEDFIDSLSFSGATVYTVKTKGEIVGYFNYSARKSGIFEIALADNALLPYVLSAFLQKNVTREITVYVNALNRALCAAFDGFAEDKSLCDDVQIKVYDVARFLEMLFTLNASVLPERGEEVFSIDGQAYRVTVNGGAVTVKVEAAAEASISMAQFLRYAIGDGNNPLCRSSRLLPLAFGISEADTF